MLNKSIIKQLINVLKGVKLFGTYKNKEVIVLDDFQVKYENKEYISIIGKACVSNDNNIDKYIDNYIFKIDTNSIKNINYSCGIEIEYYDSNLNIVLDCDCCM